MEVKKAKDILFGTSNAKARSLLGQISTCVYYEDSELIKAELERAKTYNEINDSEYEALTALHDNLQVGGKLSFMTTPVKIFSKRIWENNDLQKITQFRNCVTDMLMLDFIDFGEYVELSNEVDRYIQYSLSNGSMK